VQCCTMKSPLLCSFLPWTVLCASLYKEHSSAVQCSTMNCPMCSALPWTVLWFVVLYHEQYYV
jgi:hypothetical protein